MNQKKLLQHSRSCRHFVSSLLLHSIHYIWQGETRTSFLDGEIMVAKGAWLSVYHLFNLTTTRIQVLSIYAKSGGKNGKHGWVPQIASITSASNLSVQLFQHMFRNQFRITYSPDTSNHGHTLPISHFALLQSSSFYFLSPVLQSSRRRLYRFQNLIISGILTFIPHGRILHLQSRWCRERKLSVKMRLEKTSRFLK